MDEKLVQHMFRMTPTLDKNNRFMFFEIKKAGITSTRRGVLRSRAVIYKDKPRIYRLKFRRYSFDDISKMFKFTIVRNPFARAVSAFHFLQEHHHIPEDVGFKKFIKKKFRSLDINNIRIDMFHFHTMFDRVSYEGKLFVDFVAKLENIKRDWKYIAQKIGEPSHFPHKNRTIHKPYREYYDTECVKIVSEVYAKDLAAFKYKF